MPEYYYLFVASCVSRDVPDESSENGISTYCAAYQLCYRLTDEEVAMTKAERATSTFANAERLFREHLESQDPRAARYDVKVNRLEAEYIERAFNTILTESMEV